MSITLIQQNRTGSTLRRKILQLECTVGIKKRQSFTLKFNLIHLESQ